MDWQYKYEHPDDLDFVIGPHLMRVPVEKCRVKFHGNELRMYFDLRKSSLWAEDIFERLPYFNNTDIYESLSIYFDEQTYVDIYQEDSPECVYAGAHKLPEFFTNQLKAFYK